MRSLCSGATRPNTVVRATRRSRACSSRPSSAEPGTGSPTSRPAWVASAATVRGLSPESTLSATASVRNRAIVSATSGRSSSASATTASGSSPGRAGRPRASRRPAAASVARASTSTRRPGGRAVVHRRGGDRPAQVRRQRLGRAEHPGPRVGGEAGPAQRRGERRPRPGPPTGSAGQGGGERRAGEVGDRDGRGRTHLAPRSASRLGRGPDRHRSRSSRSRPVVRVPVLSVHTTSTLLTDSTASTCCTSAPRRRDQRGSAV